MALIPQIPKPTTPIETKSCLRCGRALPTTLFTYTRSIFYPDHHISLCHDCVTAYLRANNFEWDAVDTVCRWADIPFIVKEWERLRELNGDDGVWSVYSHIFEDECYEGLGWKDYNTQYLELRRTGFIEEEIPLVRERKYKELRQKWGPNYCDEDLQYLEELYKGLLVSQNVNGTLQDDQAKKICKLSLEVDVRIRAGDKDVDKFLSSYDKLVKIAEFTPKNTKNAVDFDSFAEVGLWLEKRGRQNKFYDGATRDVIDETIKNIQNYNQRLYINEGGIGEAITERLNALKSANALEENLYGINTEVDLTDYDNEVWKTEEEEEFDTDGEGVV